MPTFQNYNYDEPSGCSSFEINNIDLAIINGIRRVILTDIPIPGIIGEKLENDDPSVDILINNGALHNEIIIHRIGLIPICLKEEEIDDYKDNSIHIELNVKNTTNKTLDVRTSDITATRETATRNTTNITKEELATIFPANKISGDHILITRLRTGEHLHFKAKVVKRTGRDNASFNPVSLSNFSYIQDPKEADKKTNILDKERSYYKNKYGDAVRFKFDIESINHNIGPKYLVSKSLDIIMNKLELLRRELNNEPAAATAATKVKIQQFQDIAGTYEFIIEDEDDTLGNIIQSYIHNHFIRENNKYKDKISCTYIGYICPHPLKSLMILRISLEDASGAGGAAKDAISPKVFSAFLDDNCAIIAEELSKIKNDWVKFAIDNI